MKTTDYVKLGAAAFAGWFLIPDGYAIFVAGDRSLLKDSPEARARDKWMRPVCASALVYTVYTRL